MSAPSHRQRARAPFVLSRPRLLPPTAHNSSARFSNRSLSVGSRVNPRHAVAVAMSDLQNELRSAREARSAHALKTVGDAVASSLGCFGERSARKLGSCLHRTLTSYSTVASSRLMNSFGFAYLRPEGIPALSTPYKSTGSASTVLLMPDG